MDYVRGRSFFPVRLKDSENLNNPFLRTERKKYGRTQRGKRSSSLGPPIPTLHSLLAILTPHAIQ